MGLIAGGGLALGLSQLFGGWTKWGVPRVSSGVFLFGWIPAAVVVGWILLTMQPAGGWQQSRLESWSDSIGILGFVDNFEAWLTAVPALILGLVTAFVFDTSGPRQRSRRSSTSGGSGRGRPRLPARGRDATAVPTERPASPSRRETGTTGAGRTDETTWTGPHESARHDLSRGSAE